MIRQFKIYNARGDMIDLTNNGDFLAFNPQGLGVSFSNGFYGANANFLQNGLTLGQKQLVLTMMFGHKSHDGYQRYFEFVKFLNHTPYLLEYETSAGIFHRECVLNELTKNELKEEGTLQESFILDFTTPYFKTVSNKTVIVPPIEGKAGKIYETVEIIPTPPEEGATYYDKIYDYIYSPTEKKQETEESYYTYDYIYDGYEDGKDGVFIINNQSVYIDSSIGSPCQITVRGPATNPHWQIVQGSEIVQSDGFNLDIPDGYRLVVSSIPQAQRAVLVAPDGTTSNVWQQQDFSKTNFVTFPVGQSRIIFFNCKQVEFTYREESVVI